MKIIKQDLKLYIYSSGTFYIIYSKNGKRHREDGPASVWYDGEDYGYYYYVEGRTFFYDEYWKHIHENY